MPTAIAAPPPPPSGAQAVWVSSGFARLVWMQESDANMVCLSSISATGDFFNAIEDCIPSHPGMNIFDLTRTVYPYGIYYPVSGDAYYITEWRFDGSVQQYYGHYGPFALEGAQDLYVPLIRR